VSGGFLVVRRGGATWAVAHEEVRGLARRGARLRAAELSSRRWEIDATQRPFDSPWREYA